MLFSKNLLAWVATAALLVGCGGSETPEPVIPAPAPAGGANAVGVVPVSPEPPVVAPPDGGAAPAPIAAAVPNGPAESAPMDATSQERILAAMQSYVIDNSASPSSLEVLVARGYLKSIPAAPAGKKWVYNAEKLAIELADK